jgi:hypothetical protein
MLFLKSAKLLNVELIDEPDKNTKIFRVTVSLKYRRDWYSVIWLIILW